MASVTLGGAFLGQVELGRNGEASVISNKQKTWLVVFDGARDGADSYPRASIYKILQGKIHAAEQHDFLRDLRVQDEQSMSEMQFVEFDGDGHPVVYSTRGERFSIAK